MRIIVISRFLIALCLIFCLAVYFTHRDQFNISTDIKDLSPIFVENPDLQTAINTLSSTIEKKVTLVLTSNNEDTLLDATEQLTLLLNNSAYFSINENNPSEIIQPLIPYRFHLLSKKGEIEIKQPISSLKEQGKRNLFGLENSLLTDGYLQDPFGFFNQYLNSTFAIALSASNGSKSEKSKTIYYQTLTITLSEGLFSINEQKNIVTLINNSIHLIEEKFDISILKSGVLFFAEDAAKTAKQDIEFISTWSAIGVIILLFVIFTSPLPLLLALASIGIGISFASALSYSIFGSLHILTIIFGASLTGIVVDYTIHYFYHRQEITKIEPALIRAMLLSVTTSIIGYSALSFSSLAALQKIALFSCCSIAISWLCVIAFGQLIPGKPRDQQWLTDLFSILNLTPTKAQKDKLMLIWKSGLAMSFIVLILLGYQPIDNPQFFFKPSQTLLSEEQKARSYTTLFEPGRYLIIEGDSINNVYQTFEQLNNTTKNEKLSFNYFSLLQLLPSQETQKQHYEEQNKLYGPQGAVSELFAELGIDSHHAEQLMGEYLQSKNQYLDPQVLQKVAELPPLWQEINRRYFSVLLLHSNTDERTVKSLADRIPNLHYIAITTSTEQALKHQRQSAQILLFIAYGLVGLLLLYRYRKINSLQALLIPATASVLTLLTLLAIGSPVNLFTIMALYLVLGLGMDYVIFVMEMPLSQSTLQAIFFSTITSLLSFGLLSFSDIPIAHSFGMTLLIGNTLNFIAALFFAVIQQSPTQENAHD